MKLENIFNININKVKVKPFTSLDNLGWIFDRTLGFKELTYKIIQKAYNALYLHSSYLTIGINKLLIEGLVVSQFSYWSPVYGPYWDQDCFSHNRRVQD